MSKNCPKISFLSVNNYQQLFFLPVVIVNAHEATGEGHYLAECDEQGFVDLTLWIDIYTAEKHYEPSEGKHECGK